MANRFVDFGLYPPPLLRVPRRYFITGQTKCLHICSLLEVDLFPSHPLALYCTVAESQEAEYDGLCRDELSLQRRSSTVSCLDDFLCR